MPDAAQDETSTGRSIVLGRWSRATSANLDLMSTLIPPPAAEAPGPANREAYDSWIGARQIASLGSNAGASPLPFQGWHHFKEAFPPELVRLAVDEHIAPVRACFDPFGGSGTSALTAQFLGVDSTTIEVNPFLVDLIRAKLARYDADHLARTFFSLCRGAKRHRGQHADILARLPPSFVQPGTADRWIFNALVAHQLAAYIAEIDKVTDDDERRLFRVLLGGLLIEVSNVVVNGKGRRYRRGWRQRGVAPEDVTAIFAARVQSAISDVYRFADRPRASAEVVLGDARATIPGQRFDIAVFSPPYPNSFDYTDVYNVELWSLGYLRTAADNRRLRQSTFTSHVQLQREYAAAPNGSPLLSQCVVALAEIRHELWSRWIPCMIGGYFHDLLTVLGTVKDGLHDGGRCWVVVGDSRYGGVFVPTGRILAELAAAAGWTVESAKPFRSMRSSAQHGGRSELAETLLVLGRAD